MSVESEGVEDPRVEGRAGRDEVDERLARALERRDRHRERSVLVRAGVVLAGAGIGVFAALLSVVAPEFGLPLLLFGLRLLALEFDWAVGLYVKVARLAGKVAGTLGKMWPRSKLGVAVVILALAGVAGFVLL